MQNATLLVLALLVFSCNNPVFTESTKETPEAKEIPEVHSKTITQDQLKNEIMRKHEFLRGMYSDGYFPKILVDKVKVVLVELCADIESKSPKSLGELYVLTHAATERVNALQLEFEANESEIETAAREVIAEDFAFIAETYGFDADVEELIAPREW